jgi:hypothetical protein
VTIEDDDDATIGTAATTATTTTAATATVTAATLGAVPATPGQSGAQHNAEDIQASAGESPRQRRRIDTVGPYKLNPVDP